MGKAMRPALCALMAAALLCGFSRAASALPGEGSTAPRVSAAPQASAPPQAQEPPDKLVEAEPVQEVPPYQPPSGNISFPGALALVAAAGIAIVAAGVAVAAMTGRRGRSRPGVYDPSMQNMLEVERQRQQREFMSSSSTPPASPPPPPADNGTSGGGSC